MQNNRIHIAVVDDEAESIDVMKRHLETYFKQNDLEYKLSTFADGLEFLNQYRPVYDLIFMDINMHLMDGMETAQRLRKIDETVILVFMTNLGRYALNGYLVNALDYLIKPVGYGHFSLIMKKTRSLLERNKKSSIVLKMENGVRVLQTADICYAEVMDHWLIYYTENDSYKIRGSMKNLIQQLDPQSFHLCNRCYMVNLRFVRALENDQLTVGHYTLTVSRSRKKEFIQALNDYFGGTY